MRYDRGRGSLDRHPTTSPPPSSPTPVAERCQSASAKLTYGLSSGGCVSSASGNTFRLNSIDGRFEGCISHSTDSHPAERRSASTDSRSSRASPVLLIAAHRSHHQVAMVVPHPATTSSETLVRSDPNDVTVGDGHDHLTIKMRNVRIRPPCNESSNDLGHLVEPRTRTTEVERFERFGVAVASVANDHASDDSMATVGPFGDHRCPGRFGEERSRPPLARLRFGATSVASNAADRRWIVDHRASSRPFSIREMSA